MLQAQHVSFQSVRGKCCFIFCTDKKKTILPDCHRHCQDKKAVVLM